jgi:hypothetical protein
MKNWFQSLLFKFNLYRYSETAAAAAAAVLRIAVVRRRHRRRRRLRAVVIAAAAAGAAGATGTCRSRVFSLAQTAATGKGKWRRRLCEPGKVPRVRIERRRRRSPLRTRKSPRKTNTRRNTSTDESPAEEEEEEVWRQVCVRVVAYIIAAGETVAREESRMLASSRVRV